MKVNNHQRQVAPVCKSERAGRFNYNKEENFVIIKYLMFGIFWILVTGNTYAQKQNIQELKWETCEQDNCIKFKDTNEIVEWSQKCTQYSKIFSLKQFSINDSNTYILFVEGGSGRHLMLIYVFLEKDKNIECYACSVTDFDKNIKARIDDETKCIIFYTESAVIGKLQLNIKIPNSLNSKGTSSLKRCKKTIK